MPSPSVSWLKITSRKSTLLSLKFRAYHPKLQTPLSHIKFKWKLTQKPSLKLNKNCRKRSISWSSSENQTASLSFKVWWSSRRTPSRRRTPSKMLRVSLLHITWQLKPLSEGCENTWRENGKKEYKHCWLRHSLSERIRETPGRCSRQARLFRCPNEIRASVIKSIVVTIRSKSERKRKKTRRISIMSPKKSRKYMRNP